MKRARSVDGYIADATHWQSELKRLREILVSTDLDETVKWGAPCYTFGGKNVVGMAAFKTYFGLWFYQGALLDDKMQVLINAQEGRTKVLRQWRLQSVEEIKPATIRRYVSEAVKLAREGRAVTADRTRPVVIPPELKIALQGNKVVGNKFRKLRPGQQREYADYIAGAKREETKLRRIKKVLPMIKAGAGLNDRYR
jgi:uncharacterized protein YdeI (YjbR/CyaY-like superfamily)